MFRWVLKLFYGLGVFGLVFLFPLSSWGAGFHWAAFFINDEHYLLDGQRQKSDCAPFLEKNHVYLPARCLAQALGVSAEGLGWDSRARVTTLKRGEFSATLQIDSPLLITSDGMIKMEAVPILKKGRAYLPARDVAEAFGYSVGWDPETQTLTIFTAPEETTFLTSRSAISGASFTETIDAGGSYYVVQKGDTLSTIAKYFGLSVNDITGANPYLNNPNRIYAGQILFIPEKNAHFSSPANYVVQRGETLCSIARKFHLSLERLIKLNPQISNIDRLFPGQVIHVPD